MMGGTLHLQTTKKMRKVIDWFKLIKMTGDCRTACQCLSLDILRKDVGITPHKNFRFQEPVEPS